jgi:CelD/BcsL family acetyltransferase involved in cellulose biosynthesis
VVSALECLRSIEEQQSERIRGLGLPYNLDLPAISDFYRKLVIDGLACGYLVMTTLLAGGEIVAALLGVRREQIFSVLRISNAGRSWKSSSPGRLVITRTIEHMVTQGCTSFDFSIGDYEFKRRLGGKRTPLYEVTEALSWRGVPLAGKAATKGRLRRYPKLARGLRQFLARETRGAKLMVARE